MGICEVLSVRRPYSGQLSISLGIPENGGIPDHLSSVILSLPANSQRTRDTYMRTQGSFAIKFHQIKMSTLTVVIDDDLTESTVSLKTVFLLSDIEHSLLWLKKCRFVP